MGFLHEVRVFAWGEPPSTKAERNLLFKIDWFVLSYACLSYFTNYLDRSNVSNAYVSGMKEDLSMYGNELNYVNSVFSAGYIIGMIPNNLALQVIPPRFWLPLMNIIWAILTMLTSTVTTVQHLYAIRFFQAMAESSTFVGVHYILGSWYKNSELGKRAGIFASAAQVGTIFSGVLQAAIYTNLNGKAGRAGWRWLFIIDGIITIPIAIYGFLLFPDTPANTRAPYFTAEEIELAVKRLPNAHSTSRLSWNLIKRVLGRWHFYWLVALFAVSAELESYGINGCMGLFMKAVGGYSVQNINYYPTGLTAFAIVTTLFWSALTDYTKIRWPATIFMSLCLIFSAAVLLSPAPTSDHALMFAAFYISGAGYVGQGVNFSWANEICWKDGNERGVVLASMNAFSSVINIWYSIVAFPVSSAPRFRKGGIATLVMAFASSFIAIGTRVLQLREERLDREKGVVIDGEVVLEGGGGKREGEDVEQAERESREVGSVAVARGSVEEKEKEVESSE